MPRAVRSFADDLRARSTSELAALFLARPDLVHPAPTDVTSLAARAQTRASVQRALNQLDALQLRLLEAVLAVGAEHAATTLGATKRAVDAGIRELWNLALMWRSTDGWRPVRAAAETLTYPAGLGPLARDVGIREPQLALTATSSVAERETAEKALSERAHAVIEQLRWSTHRASFPTPVLRAVRAELLDAGFMAPLEGDDAVIPREVGLALRDGRLYPTAWAAPEPEIPTRETARIDDTAAAAALDLLWRMDDIAAAWDETPPRVLRSGGLSVRDHRALAVAIDSSTTLTAFLVEIGHAAGLFAPDGETEPAWHPTDLYDEWATQPPQHRWAALATAWLTTARAPSRAGQAVDGTLINVLARDATWPLLRRRREEVLTLLTGMPAGAAPSVETLEELLRWQHPLQLPAGAPTHIDVVLREAGWLGVVGMDALSSAGRAVLERRDDAAAIMARALPKPVEQVMIQGDLTAVAPGPLTAEVATFMRRGAVVESRGGATVFRFTPESIRRLLDAGQTASEVMERLTRYSMTPIPQALDYLVHDVARKHGHVRVGSVGSYVRADDEHALDALMADSSLSSLHLRRLAPTVAVSPVPAPALLEALREARHAPVAETSDGGVVVRTEHVKRSPTPRRASPPVRVTRLEQHDAEKLATDVRAGEADAAGSNGHDANTRIPSTDPTVTLTVLDDAAAEGVPVWIGYVDSSGDIKRTRFHPERVDGGRVSGRLGDATRTSTLSIHRITGATSA